MRVNVMLLPLLGTATGFVVSGLGRSISRGTSRIHKAPAVSMMFWKPPGPSPATRLAKTPALDKTLSDEEWKAKLDPTTYQVLRKKATEPRGVNIAKGGFDDLFKEGTYVCAGCGSELYDSSHKFDCGCGWPGFWTNVQDAVYEQRDADGMRCEVLCAHCDGHLGHVFRGEGFNNPEPNERHCVNSVSVAFKPRATPDEVQPCTYRGPVYGGSA